MESLVVGVSPVKPRKAGKGQVVDESWVWPNLGQVKLGKVVSGVDLRVLVVWSEFKRSFIETIHRTARIEASELVQAIGSSELRKQVMNDLLKGLREQPWFFWVRFLGGIGDDGTLQSLLEAEGVPYTGPGAQAFEVWRRRAAKVAEAVRRDERLRLATAATGMGGATMDNEPEGREAPVEDSLSCSLSMVKKKKRPPGPATSSSSCLLGWLRLGLFLLTKLQVCRQDGLEAGLDMFTKAFSLSKML
ncbi:hypothetical protein Droror1_Dr00000422 [Drosera rotundifolia]